VFKEMEKDETDEDENVGENDEIDLSDLGKGKLFCDSSKLTLSWENKSISSFCLILSFSFISSSSLSSNVS
jgi:hypothetical protein